MSLGKYLPEGPGVGFINVCLTGRWPCPWPCDLSGHMIFSREQIKITSVSRLPKTGNFRHLQIRIKMVFMFPIWRRGVEHLKLYRVSLGFFYFCGYVLICEK